MSCAGGKEVEHGLPRGTAIEVVPRAGVEGEQMGCNESRAKQPGARSIVSEVQIDTKYKRLKGGEWEGGWGDGGNNADCQQRVNKEGTQKAAKGSKGQQ